MLTMQRHKKWSHSTAPLGNIGDLISAIGTDEFVRQTLTLLDEELGLDHISIVRWRSAGRIDFHGAASTAGAKAIDTAARQYFSRFNKFDPVRSFQRDGIMTGTGVLVSLRAEDVADPVYREQCYTNPGVAERMTFYASVDRRIFQLNLYRSVGRPTFAEHDKQRLVDLAAIVLPSAARHADLTHSAAEGPAHSLSIEALKHRVGLIDAGLSERELEVCARALYGQSIEGTALDMEIGRTSVATYRRRAYAKLGISCYNELFALAF